jgi:hypothetical protein
VIRFILPWLLVALLLMQSLSQFMFVEQMKKMLHDCWKEKNQLELKYQVKVALLEKEMCYKENKK